MDKLPTDQTKTSIFVADGNETIFFAAEELKKRLVRAGFEAVIDAGEGPGILLGLMSDIPQATAPVVADPAMDDAVDIAVKGTTGYISGINPRSVLLGVYRYLTELGFRWVRPGEDGEIVPELENLPDVRLCETPSYRYRTVCIEGAVSLDHVKDIIDWLPKVGFNGYFIQFREAHTFFDRWYAHEMNPLMEGCPITVEQARDFTGQVEREIAKRSLIYHKVGHGWTCEPFGINGLGWDTIDHVPENVSQYFALLDGERKLFGGTPLNTNLCYSNPEVRRLVTEEIVTYAEQNPQIDLLHFWLADGANNNCECDECRKARPSDFYVMMLNQLDDLLTEKGLPTKIVALIYVDLLWPPIQEKIANPDRFVLMFAPITRTYSKPFTCDEALPAIPPYKRNKLTFPRNVAENLAFLNAWQKDQLLSDGFDFDYHLMWDHYLDPGHMAISETISRDMKALSDIGLNGYASCQIQRLFLPTGLAMTVMGKTLWNRDIEFEDIVSDYFSAAFGPNGELAMRYLTKLSELFDPVYLRKEKPEESAESAAQRYASIPGVIDDFLPTIRGNAKLGNPVQALSWAYLEHHADIYRGLASAYEARTRGDLESASKRWEEVKQIAAQKEKTMHPVFDIYHFISTLGQQFAVTEE